MDVYNVLSYAKNPLDSSQQITHQTWTEQNYLCKKQTIVIAETLNNITFVDKDQQVKHQTKIKIKIFAMMLFLFTYQNNNKYFLG